MMMSKTRTPGRKTATRRWTWIGLLFGTVGVAVPGVGQAQILGTGNVSTETTQVANNIELALSVATQVQQLVALQQQIKSLGSSDWGQGPQQLQDLDALVQRSTALAYSAGNVDQQFRSLYPGYEAFVDAKLGPTGFLERYQNWSSTLNDQVLAALRVARAQSKMMPTEQGTVQRVAAFSDGAAGQLQAQQSTNQLLAQTIDQLQKLRQLMMTQMQLQAEFYAAQQNKEAAQRAALERFNATQRIDYRNGKGF